MSTEDDFFQEHEGKARAWALEAIADRLNRGAIHASRRLVDSPLEAAFAVWFDHVARVVSGGDMYLLEQHEVIANGNNYRLDFIVVHFGHEGHEHTKIAVELDGHAFHEKTLEQVTRRNQRDRDLQLAGWRVMHYSFSEFVKQPLHAAIDVYGAGVNWLTEERANRRVVAARAANNDRLSDSGITGAE